MRPGSSWATIHPTWTQTFLKPEGEQKRLGVRRHSAQTDSVEPWPWHTEFLKHEIRFASLSQRRADRLLNELSSAGWVGRTKSPTSRPFIGERGNGWSLWDTIWFKGRAKLRPLRGSEGLQGYLTGESLKQETSSPQEEKIKKPEKQWVVPSTCTQSERNISVHLQTQPEVT